MPAIKVQSNPKHTAVPTSVTACTDRSVHTEYVVTYDHNVNEKEMPDLLIDGTLYLPVTGNLITPELAEKRLQLRRDGVCAWRDKSCVPGYTMRYVPLHSRLISAMGRI